MFWKIIITAICVVVFTLTASVLGAILLCMIALDIVFLIYEFSALFPGKDCN